MPESPALELPDYGEDVPKLRSIQECWGEVNGLIGEAQGYEKDIETLEAQLSKKKESLKSVLENRLPAILLACGVKEFKTEAGLVITVREKVETSVPKPRREEAWTWLCDNGHGDIVKREVAVTFGVKEGDKADALAKKLATEFARSVSVERWAEPATLKSIITERLKGGKSVDTALFGVRQFKVAEFKVPPEKGKKAAAAAADDISF